MNLSREEFLAYTNNQLPVDKKEAIDLYLKENPLERKALEGAMSLRGEPTFEALLDDIESRLPKETEISFSESNSLTQALKKSWLILLLIVALMGVFAYMQMNNSDAEELQYAHYFEAYPDVVTETLRGDKSNNSAQIASAFKAYNQGDFDNATDLFNQLTTHNQVDERLKFYKAVSMTGAGKYDEAYRLLGNLADNPGFPYMDGVYWNKAICALSLGYNTEARDLLQLIMEENLYKKEEAAQLLHQLEK